MEISEVSSIKCNLRLAEITGLLQKVVDSMKVRLGSGVAMNYVPGSAECVISTDPDLLGQIFRNLIDNACKFTSKGAVTVGYEEYEEEIYFFVKDTGIGLSADTKAKIEAIANGEDGSGKGMMGLVMTAAIIKALGGTCGVESRGEGKGSNFWFTFPNAPATLPVEEVAAGVAAESGQSSQADQNAAPKDRLTMLIAEDNESNYLLFKYILSNKYTLIRAHDGVEAVEQFRAQHPDIILMDINMPNMDGYEAVSIIRKEDTQTPIIAVTAYAFITDRQRILENGFNGYVSKPINIKRLEQEIAGCLAQQSI